MYSVRFNIPSVLIILLLVINESVCIFPVPFNILKDITDHLGQTQTKSNSSEYLNYRANVNENYEFDFIIVGAGPAGSVLANRLSEIPHWNILLIEAGQNENFITDVPAFCAMLQLTDFNWGYKMEKQDGACLGMIDQQCAWPRGKALGGTSVINYMIYTRGNKYDFEKWTGQGNPGWSWDDVVPYYKRSEKAHLLLSDVEQHGTDGYLNVENIPFRTPLLKAFLRSGQETGHKILDYNGNSQFGFSPVQATLRRGSRCSAAKSYLNPIKYRSNLKILSLTRVSKILIDEKTNSAYGVEYVQQNKKYVAFARKEVILSAGTFASPQLLMLSGIGPEDHLKELDIPVLKNLPGVGKNLHDHLTFYGLSFLIDQKASLTLDKALSISAFLNYTLNHNGPLTSIGGVEALGYIKTNVTNDTPDDFPDIELIFAAASISSDGGGAVREGLRLNSSFYDAVYKPINNRESWTIIPMLLHPKSIGHLKLKSKNVFDHPKLYGNYYSDPEGKDIATMVAAVKEIIKLSETKAFQKFGSKLHSIPFPNCRHLSFGSDAYWECCLRTITPSLHHQVGTCKMGPSSDPTAVVDAELKVHGIQHLRVVDTSIIPFALSAHTNAPSFMIGERAADFIKTQWLNYT